MHKAILALLIAAAAPVLAEELSFDAFGPFAPRAANPAAGGKSAADVVDMSLSYREASEKAAREGKPLYVWVRYKCPSSAAQLPEAVHCFVESFDGDRTQRVVTSYPADGWLRRGEEIAAEDCCASSLRRAVQRLSHQQGWSVQPALRPSLRSGFFSGASHGDCAT